MKVIAHKVKAGIARIDNIKNIIAVTSGKGGVGKSTTAVNIAIMLANKGFEVGLLDADIYGPSVPMLVAARDFKPDVKDDQFVPLEKYGIKILSFGFLINETQPAIWRGAIVNKAINQLLYDNNWGNLDYLIVDMPPGTGDIHLSMCQKMPITSTVVVTTPQDIALIDVNKSIEMYKKLEIPCIGIIENMSYHICSNCGYQENTFGNNGVDKVAFERQYTILAKMPLDINLRLCSDLGIPVTSNITNDAINVNAIHALKNQYNQLVDNMLLEIDKLPKDYSSKLGKLMQV